MAGIMTSGFGLSAFLFSIIARTIFPGDTSSFLLVLAFVPPISMVLGWFIVRICPYPEDIARTAPERINCDELDNPILTPNEASLLLVKNIPSRQLDITGLTMLRTIDFWILFWIVSLCECLRCDTGVVR